MNHSQASPKRKRTRLLELLAAGALLVVLLVVLFDWNMLRGPIERRVSDATGRPFQIAGDLSVDLSLKPRVTVGSISLGNIPGAEDAKMVRVERLDFRLDLLKLLVGDVVLSDVKVDSPDILLERTAVGQPNWIFKRGDREWPDIQQLQVSEGLLRFRDPARRTDMRFDIRSGDPSRDARLAPLLIDGSGSYVGNPVQVEGRVESPLVLKDPGKPYHVDLKARAGATRATAVGNLIGPLQLSGFDLQLGLSGPSLELLYPLLGIALPETPPYRLLGRLTHQKNRWQYDRFTGMVGDSDLSGDASIQTGRERPLLTADLVSRRLDLDDLGGFIGAPPQVSGDETSSPEQNRDAAKLQASSRVLPSDEFKLDKLRSMDADVRLRAERLETKLPLQAMDARLFLEDGLLRLDPIEFKAAGGSIGGSIRLDARKQSIASSARLVARGLSLPDLLPDAELARESIGRLGGSLNLAGQGNSIAQMLATADGDVGLIMGKGKISNLLLEFAGIDIAESLKFLIGKDRTVPVRCAFGEFKVENGVMTAQRLAFDTTDTVIMGKGTVSLREERLDLVLKPLPKDRSFLALRSPLLVTGTFKDPSFRPDVRRITLRGLAAAVLASIAPPAALLAVFESGPGEDIACGTGP